MARGDFDIIDHKPIGCGQFGTVFLARRRSDERTVALKLVLRKGEGGAERIAAERHGAILQQRFAELHGMVPEVYDIGLDGDDLFIAMEFLEGPSLEELLRNGAFTAREAVEHALWLCEFLDKAHGFSCTVEGKPYRLLHNDLKPAHIKISAAGERKVLDFGISKALEESRELATDVARTIAYAAPERLQSERVNVHADFWSLGVMVYEMACGHRPYRALDGPRFRRQLYHAITTHAPREPLPPECPKHLAAIINRLLAFQPEHRYQSAAAIREDLERFLHGETPDAAAYYDTPATMPVTRDADEAVPSPVTPETTPYVPPPTVAPTDPVPPGSTGGVGVLDPVSAPPALPAVIVRRSFRRRVASAVMSMAFVGIVATEGVGCLAAERFHNRIPLIDERNVTSHHDAYHAVERWALLDLGLRVGVDGELLPALKAVGDRVIQDYRNESPVMGPLEWQQAHAAFSWARELSPRDRPLRAKQLIAEAHAKRLSAPKDLSPSAAVSWAQTVVAKLREAAQVDKDSYDPYLGMAVVQAYSLADVDAVTTSIEEAVKRGYESTRRETALLADGYRTRGRSSRLRALTLTGDLRVKEFMKARADLERCVALFEPILEFGNAARNLEQCKAQIALIDRQLVPFELPIQW